MSADVLSSAEALAQAKRMAGYKSFVLVGADDLNHTYSCMPHGLDGGDWCIEVAGLIALPLSRLAQGKLLVLFKAYMASQGKGLKVEFDMEKLIAELDGDGDLNLANAAKDVIDSLRRLGSARLATLLKYTTRDGLGLDVDDELQLPNYEAFVRANWREWREALIRVFDINGFADFLFSTSDSEDEDSEKSPNESEQPDT